MHPVCLAATVAFFSANTLKIVYYIRLERQDFDFEQFKDLDPDYLETAWDFSLERLFLVAGILNAFAWLLLASPIIQMAWVLSAQGKQGLGITTTIAILVTVTVLLEGMANLMWVGMIMASFQLVTHFNLDNWVRSDIVNSVGGSSVGGDGVGWRSLEVNAFVATGFIWYLDVIEWLCWTAILLLTFIRVVQWRKTDAMSFGARWNSLTLFVGILCVVEFVLEILQYDGFDKVGPFAIVYALINRLILIPAWILGLGIQLPRAIMTQAMTSPANSSSVNPIAGELAMSELNLEELQTSSTQPPTFTIGHQDDDIH